MGIKTSAIAALIVGATGSAQASSLTIEIENTNPDGGFSFTPFWVGVHNGGFDSYDGGTFAGEGITAVAEIGDTGPISSEFAASAAGLAGGVDATVTAVSGDGDAPVFGAGESAIFNIDVGDSTVNRYFSYAAMVLPSNDLFVANGNPLAHAVFNEDGSFAGPLVIEIYGRDVNDNGTEVNSASNDAAFSALDGQALPEFAVIRNFFTAEGDQAYLDSFIGTQTAVGGTITSAFGSGDLIGRITITPAPGTAGLVALGGLLAARRRRG